MCIFFVYIRMFVCLYVCMYVCVYVFVFVFVLRGAGRNKKITVLKLMIPWLQELHSILYIY